MKIAFYMTTILEYGGGFEKYLIETAKELSAYPGVEIDIITLDDAWTEKISKILNVFYLRRNKAKVSYNENLETIKNKLGKANYYKINSIRNLTKILNNYEIIYSKNEILEAFILKFLVGYKKIPKVIFGCHTAIFYPSTLTIQSKIHNFLYNGWFYKFLTNGVLKFHVLNNSDELRLKNLFPKKEIKKIYNSFNIEEFKKKSINFKYDLKLDKSKFNIVWIGRITEQKGIDDLINLIININNTLCYSKIAWNIIGVGKDKQKIIDIQKKYTNVNYFGYLENNFIANILSQNNLFISTSKWEGYPYNILEALTMNIPTIAYNISGCNDIIVNGKNGILSNSFSEFEEGIISCIKNKTNFGDTSLLLSSTVNPKTIYKELLTFFKL